MTFWSLMILILTWAIKECIIFEITFGRLWPFSFVSLSHTYISRDCKGRPPHPNPQPHRYGTFGVNPFSVTSSGGRWWKMKRSPSLAQFSERLWRHLHRPTPPFSVSGAGEHWTGLRHLDDKGKASRLDHVNMWPPTPGETESGTLTEWTDPVDWAPNRSVMSNWPWHLYFELL